jgi:hypothetical protein
VQVDVDHPLRRRVVLVDEAAERHDPGVVDQDVEWPQPLRDLIEEVGERVAARDVELEADRLPAQLGRRLIGERLVEVTDRNLGALAHERGRGRLADSAGPPCDCDHLAS